MNIKKDVQRNRLRKHCTTPITRKRMFIKWDENWWCADKAYRGLHLPTGVWIFFHIILRLLYPQHRLLWAYN